MLTLGQEGARRHLAHPPSTRLQLQPTSASLFIGSLALVAGR